MIDNLLYEFKKLIKTIFYLFHTIIRNIFKKDYSGKGERQVSPTIDGIRKDHVGRYKFACRLVNKDDVVLDCASGVAYGSYILSKETQLSKIIAVDKERKAIKFARKYYFDKKIIYRLGDIFHLDIPNEYFNCIVSFETVEHVDGEKLIKLFYKKLKRNGRFIVSVPNQDTQPFNKKSFPFHLRHYTPSEFDALFVSNGFEILGRYTQYNREEEEILEGWNGLFNIAIAKKL